jgi:acetylserotonin N-methyltransferase
MYSMYSKDRDVLRFMHGMHGFSKVSAKPVLTAFDLSNYRTLVDLGGATGALAIAALELYPTLNQAVVVDLKTVIERSQEHFTKPPFVQQPEVLPRLSWVVADFFDDPLPQGDLYVMGRILHDWEEARCLKLLRTVYDKLPPGTVFRHCIEKNHTAGVVVVVCRRTASL